MDEDPDDVFAWEYTAITYQLLGKTLEALEAYEEVYRREGGNYYLYQIAGLQFNYDRNRECMESIKKLLDSDSLGDEKIELVQGQLREKVFMEAAVYNLKGNLHQRQGDTEAARAAFQRSLEIEPGFELAKNNLEALK